MTMNQIGPTAPSNERLRHLLLFLATYACVFFALAARKYRVMNSISGDMAIFVNAFWNTIHGRFFYSVYYDMSHFGVHVTPGVLVCLPFYWLIPSAYTLLLIQSLVLAASGVPVYLLARKVLEDERAAWLMTVAYLFYPTVVTNHVNQIHAEYWSLPYLLAAVYCYTIGSFWSFVGFATLGMTGQENLPLTIGMFGLLAWAQRRDWRWIVAPVALALAYGLIAFNVVIPHFAGKRGYLVSYYFGTLGETPGELIRTCLTQPGKLIEQMWQLDRASYLLLLLQPLLLVAPFFCREFLLVLPSLGINLIVNQTAFRLMQWHYNPTVGALLCIAAIFGVRSLSERLNKHWQLNNASVVLAFGICALCLTSWPYWLNAREYFPHAYTSTLKRAAEMIPPNKSLLAPITMLAHFSDRPLAVHLHQFSPKRPMQETWPQEKMYTLDYIILDLNDHRFPPDIATPELATSFSTNSNYKLIFNENKVFVFRRHESVGMTR